MTIIKGNDVKVSISKDGIGDGLLIDEFKRKTGKSFAIESMSKNEEKVVSCGMHSLIGACQLAYSNHKRLVLSPDVIWLTILQNVAIHVNENSEALRSKFVSFDDKKEIEVIRNDFIKGKENPWEETFPVFISKVKVFIGDENYNILINDFTTSDEITKSAMYISVMDVVQSYFDFKFKTLCGIPEFELEGTKEDWELILSNAKKLSKYDMDWWLDAMIPTLEQFVSAVSGKPDTKFWQEFFKEDGGSGGPYIHGHVNTLFPYKLEYQRKDGVYKKGFDKVDFKEKYRFFGGMTTDAYPSGMSSVPFVWNYYGTFYKMKFFSGFVGLKYKNNSVAPNIAWSVAEEKAVNGKDEDEDEEATPLRTNKPATLEMLKTDLTTGKETIIVVKMDAEID